MEIKELCKKVQRIKQLLLLVKIPLAPKRAHKWQQRFSSVPRQSSYLMGNHEDSREKILQMLFISQVQEKMNQLLRLFCKDITLGSGEENKREAALFIMMLEFFHTRTFSQIKYNLPFPNKICCYLRVVSVSRASLKSLQDLKQKGFKRFVCFSLQRWAARGPQRSLEVLTS